MATAIFDKAAGVLVGSYYSAAVCVAIVTVLLLIIMWIGKMGNVEYDTVKWTGAVAAAGLLGVGFLYSKTHHESGGGGGLLSQAEGALGL